MLSGEKRNIWQRYAELLGIENKTVYLGEGDTPLVPSRAIGASLKFDHLYFKLENLNPTGSFKDRFIALETAFMLDARQRVCIATSSGNTGSSLAAYAARYGISCHIFVNERTPGGKLQQMLAHGARIYRVRNFGLSAEDTMGTFARLQHFAQEKNYRLIVSAFRYSPRGMQGIKTLAYEIVERIGSPDHVFVPVGGGGLLAAIWRGFGNCREQGVIERLPKIHAVQPRGCATVVNALLSGSDKINPIDSDTAISGLAVPFDIDGSLALAAVRDSGGSGFAVADEEIWEAQALLCREEGIYAEPAGAAALAGFLQAFRQGSICHREIAVCLVTGHGFKDPTSIKRMNVGNLIPIINLGEVFDLRFD